MMQRADQQGSSSRNHDPNKVAVVVVLFRSFLRDRARRCFEVAVKMRSDYSAKHPSSMVELGAVRKPSPSELAF